MPNGHNFEHLPLVLCSTGPALIRGGGKQSLQTKANQLGCLPRSSINPQSAKTSISASRKPTSNGMGGGFCGGKVAGFDGDRGKVRDTRGWHGFQGLRRVLALPAAVRGPVDFWALRRLAAICFGVDI